MPPCLYDFGAGFTSDSSQWEDLESTDLDVCGVTMPQETCALRSRSRSTVAAPSDFSVNFLRLKWAEGEEFEPKSGHVRESAQPRSEGRAT